MLSATETTADSQRLARVAGGDAAALAELYDRHASMLLGLVCRILGDRAEAEDVMQEVFVRVWERAGSYNSLLGSPGAWLSRIARNRAIDRLRARAVRPEFADSDLATTQAAPERGTNPEAEARVAEERRAVVDALATLQPDQRRLIEHAYYLGFSQSELATHFQLPLGTVKTRIRAGMMSLRTQLQGDWGAVTSDLRPQP